MTGNESLIECHRCTICGARKSAPICGACGSVPLGFKKTVKR